MSEPLSQGWIDVTVPISSGMVHWPGDPPARISRAKSIEAGDEANVSHLDMGAHTGTHMDAPVHFIDGAAGIDSLPFDATLGPARVVEIADPDAVKPEELRRHDPASGERLLFKTRNSSRRWVGEEFDRGFVHVTPDAASLLAERQVRTVGMDYLSVGGLDDGGPTHRALLEAGIWIIEGLDLVDVHPGHYELVCLPLRIAGSDGAPSRAMLRPIPS